jgi:hypothetical protein
VAPAAGAGFAIAGSTPLLGWITPPVWLSLSLRLPLAFDESSPGDDLSGIGLAGAVDCAHAELGDDARQTVTAANPIAAAILTVRPFPR